MKDDSFEKRLGALWDMFTEVSSSTGKVTGVRASERVGVAEVVKQTKCRDKQHLVRLEA